MAAIEDMDSIVVTNGVRPSKASRTQPPTK
jgi:hypothetical protein